jgi:hypothetical protein
MFWSFLIVTLVLLLFIYIAGRLKPKSATLAQKHVVVSIKLSAIFNIYNAGFSSLGFQAVEY